MDGFKLKRLMHVDGLDAGLPENFEILHDPSKALSTHG
jgi:hypothetical protein